MRNFRNIFSSKLFLLGFIIKICFFFIPGKHYLTDLFIPFLDAAILHLGENPWSLSSTHHFPYGTFLFGVLFLPKYLGYLIFGAQALGSSLLSCFLVKVVLLGFDCLFLLTLKYFVDFSYKRLLIFYWLNPILIYISYFHGQLDVVVMTMTCIALLLAIRDQIWSSAAVFSLALLSKFHVIALVPFILAYFWVNFFTRDALLKLSKWSTTVFLVTSLGFLPLLLAKTAAYISLGSPEAFRVFSWKLHLGSLEVVYMGVLLFLVLLGRLILSTKITPSGLFFGTGSLMITLVFITDPMPGWYYWLVPFCAVLYAQYRSLPHSLWLFFFLSYFSFFELCDFFHAPLLIKNLSLTALQSSLIGFMSGFVYLVFPFEISVSRRSKPNLIGLSGDSGSGKNYFSNILKDLFGQKETVVLEGDNYHRWERHDEKWDTFTHLDPQANNLAELQEHAGKIKLGKSIMIREYDHGSGKFTEAREFNPAKTVIFQGLHALFSRSFRDQLDLKIFLNPSIEVRKNWKIKRDVQERGHRLEKVLNSMKSREADAQRFIVPQKEKSDWAIEYFLQDLSEVLLFRYEIQNKPGLLEFFELLRTQGLDLKIEPSTQSLDLILITFEKQKISVGQIAHLANSIFPRLRPILRSHTPPRWYANDQGIHQLTAVFLLHAKLEEPV